MTTIDGPKPAKGGFNWTQIHLVYFALAAFDLLAILAGFILSERASASHQATVNTLQQINFLREEVRAKQAYLVDLGAVASDLFATRDAKLAAAELQRQQELFKQVFSVEKFEERISKKFFREGMEEGNVPNGDHDASLRTQLWAIDAETLKRFALFENSVSSRSQDIMTETKSVIDNYVKGKEDIAIVTLSRSDLISRNTLGYVSAISKLLDKTMQDAAVKAQVTLQRSTYLQFLVGSAIFLMIVMACTYAHFVGKLLKRKYDELQKANEDAEAYGAQVQRVNDDVSKLNTDLSDNLKKLRDAQDELIKKGRMEQLGQLTATVAHELRNPLGSVRTSTFLVERKTAGKNLGLEQQIKRINNGVTRCDTIITQLLDFSRQNRAVTAMTDIDSWLEHIVVEEAAKLPEAVHVSCELGMAGTMVPIDGTRLQRAIINLLSNASEAMVGKGDDAKASEGHQPMIRLTTRRVGNRAHISVSDNGPGMSADILAKVREPLFTTKSFGTGLGIPAIEQIVAQHGGHLDISSEPGKGATFVLSLPLEQVQEQDAA